MGNTIIKANCLDQRLILSSTPLIASGGVNENIAEFDFCPLWDGFSKTAIFYRDETEKYYAIIDSENKCVIPWEVLQSDGKLFFGVYGVKGDVRRTTEILGYKIKLGAFDKKLKPSEPTPDIYSQYVNKIAAVENRMTPVEEFTIKPTSFELTGNPIQMQNYEGMPFSAIETQFSPKQEGSGDPSPTNIRPISGYENLHLTRCEKNLIDPSRYEKSGTIAGVEYTVNDDGSVLLNGTATGTSIFNLYIGSDANGKSFLAPGKTYTISFGSAFAAIPGTARMVVGYKAIQTDDWSYPVNQYGLESFTFTLPDDANYCLCRIRLSAGDVCDNVLVTPQIELGSATTAFEPYRGDTYAVQMGQTVYGGKMNWLTGELTAEWACEDAAELSWAYNSNGFAYTTGLNRANTGAFSCSHYRNAGSQTNDSAPGRDKAISRYTSNAYLRIMDSAYKSLAEYTAFFAAQSAAGTPVQIVYELAEPEIIQFTPQHIAALDGTNTLYGEGDIKVAGRKDIIWLTSDLIKRKADKLNEPVLIDTITIEEDVKSIYITNEPDGTPYSFKKMVVRIQANPTASIGNWELYPFTYAVYNDSITLREFPSKTATHYGQFVCDVYDGFLNLYCQKGSYDTVLTSMYATCVKAINHPINQFNLRTTTGIAAGTAIEIWGIRA